MGTGRIGDTNVADKKSFLYHRPPDPKKRQEFIDGLEPWYTHITDDGFSPPGADGLEDPKTSSMVAVEMATDKFHQYAEWEWMRWKGAKKAQLDSKTLWLDGMMYRVVKRVFVASDDGTDLFAFFYIMNDKQATTILGRLLPNHEFTLELIDRMAKWVASRSK